MHDRRARYVANHDGDTVTMMLDQDFYDTKTINIRLANVWAPELNEEGGDIVLWYVNQWFTKRIVAASDKTTWPFLVVVHRTRTDKEQLTLGRYVADIMTVDGKEHLNSDVMHYIVDNGYTGGIGSIVRKGDT